MLTSHEPSPVDTPVAGDRPPRDRLRLLLVLTEFPPRIGGMQTHADAIGQCDQITSEQILARPVTGHEAWLIDQWGITHAIGARAMIGRASGSIDLTVLHPSVSATHACIEKRGSSRRPPGGSEAPGGENLGSWYLIDFDSLNGTYLNGRRIADAELSLGDEIEIGSMQIVVSRGRRSVARAKDESRPSTGRSAASSTPIPGRTATSRATSTAAVEAGAVRRRCNAARCRTSPATAATC